MNEKDMMSMAEAAMEDKYGETFVTIDVSDEGETFAAWLRPDNMPEIVVNADLNNDGTGLVDNYVSKIMSHRISSDAKKLMKDYSGDFYLWTGTDEDFSAETDTGITLHDYLARYGGDEFHMMILADRDDLNKEELYRSVSAVINGIEMPDGRIEIYVLQDRLADVQNEIESYDDAEDIEVKKLLADVSGITISMSEGQAMPSMDEFFGGLGI